MHPPEARPVDGHGFARRKSSFAFALRWITGFFAFAGVLTATFAVRGVAASVDPLAAALERKSVVETKTAKKIRMDRFYP